VNFIPCILLFYHYCAACVLKNGKIVAAAQKEMFTRKKYGKI
jgi:carbamoyltransferase